jgi:hypothetical protein
VLGRDNIPAPWTMNDKTSPNTKTFVSSFGRMMERDWPPSRTTIRPSTMYMDAAKSVGPRRSRTDCMMYELWEKSGYWVDDCARPIYPTVSTAMDKC